MKHVALAVVCLGCGGAPVSAPPAPPVSAPPSAAASGPPSAAESVATPHPKMLGAALLQDVGVGQAVAIVSGTAGLRAISADGARQRVLVPRPTPWVLVDNDAGVVWFGSPDGTELELLDLEASDTTPPVTVARNLPTETGAGAPEFTIRRGDAELTFGHPIRPHIVVTLGPTPGLSVDPGILEAWEQTATVADPVAKAPLPARELLVALDKRVAARPGRDVPTQPPEQRLDTIDKSNCEDQQICGTAQPVVGTKYWRVAVAFSCGDGCYTDWRLYDPTAKEFLEDEWANWLVSAWVAPDGSAFVANGVVVRFDSGPLEATPAGEDAGSGGGWLGGGVLYWL